MNPASDQLARIVWTQCWQVSLLIVVVGGIAHTVCRRRPHVAHLLWMLVLVKCLTPPVWSSRLGVFSWAQADSVAATTAVNSFEEDSWLRSMFSEGAPLAPVPEAQPAVQVAAAEPPATSSMAGVLAGVWLVGAAGLALLTGLNWWTCYRAFRQSHVTPDPALTSVLQRLAGRLGLRRPIRLVVTSRPLGPAVFGLLQPTLVLPQTVLKGKSPREIEPIVAHELVHLRRGDVLVSGLQAIVQLLWWFHPLVWWANRQASRVCERCCDEEVVAGLGYEPYDYARCLLNVLERTHALRPVFAFPGLRAAEITSRRLENIMKRANQFHARMPRAYWLVLLAAGVLVLPGAGLTLSASPQASDQAEAGASDEAAVPTNDNSRTADAERNAEAALKALGAKIVRNDFDEVYSFTIEDSRQFGDNDLTRLSKLRWSRNLATTPSPHGKETYFHPSLILLGTQVTDDGMPKITKMTQFRYLSLSQNTGITNKALEHLKDHISLKGLNLNGTSIQDDGLDHLRGLAELKALTLIHTNITNNGLKRLKSRTNLTELGLGATKVNKDGLVHLADLKNLKSLTLFSLGLDDASLAHLKDLKSLEYLHLMNNKISDEGLVHLAGLNHLYALFLQGNSDITDEGLVHLEGLTNLTWLTLNKTPITSEGLRHLRNIADLQFLGLGDTNVDDDALPHLKNLTKLIHLLLEGTNVSDEAIEELHKSLPKCQIFYDGGSLGPETSLAGY